MGSVIYSLPFVVQPLQNSFNSVGKQSMEVAATLGASKIDRFFTVAIPLARSGFITAAVLGFAHTIGEFGVVLMIGGNIPGETGVLSIAIYDHVETMEYGKAHWLSAGLLIISFLMLVFHKEGRSYAVLLIKCVFPIICAPTDQNMNVGWVVYFLKTILVVDLVR